MLLVWLLLSDAASLAALVAEAEELASEDLIKRLFGLVEVP